MVPRDCFASAYLHTTPGGLRGHRMLQALNPSQRSAIEIASEDSNRLYSTVYAFVVIIVHHMGPQGREDPLCSTVSEFAVLAGRAVVVAYMK